MSGEREPFEVLRPSRGNIYAFRDSLRQRKGFSFFTVLLLSIIVFAAGFGGSIYLQSTDKLPEFLTALINNEPEAEPEPIVIEETTITRETIEEAIAPASDLVILSYKYKDAATVADVKKFFGFEIPATKSKAVFTYTGAIKVGFDIAKVNIAIDDDSKTITLSLPPFGIISNEIDLDSFEFVLEDSSPFNPLQMSKSTGVLSELKGKAEEQVLSDIDFMSQAQANAENVLSTFLYAAGIDSDYTIIFEYQEQ